MNIQERIEALETEFNEKIKTLKAEVQREDEFPQDGDKYWLIEETLGVSRYAWAGDDFDNKLLSVGNVFRTKQQAEFAIEKLKVEAELRKFSRPFLWGTENTAILFDGYDFKFDTRLGYVFQGVIYFESRAKAQQAIQAVGEERIKKYIFGVED